MTLYVHLIVMQSSNGQLLRQPGHSRPKCHTAKFCSVADRQRIINALANGDSKRAIARALHVSNNTVDAVAEQDWQRVEARKQRIAAQAELNATLAAERITDQLQSTKQIPLNILVPVFGVSADKLLQLRGDASLTIRHKLTLSTDDKLLEAMREANARAEKRLQARGVEVPALPPGDASVAGENAAQKEN